MFLFVNDTLSSLYFVAFMCVFAKTLAIEKQETGIDYFETMTNA
jgi:hypothetical protein